MISVVSRLIDQKGFDLIAAVADPLLQNVACQLVVMGTGEMRHHDMLNALAARYPEQVAVLLTFNRPLEQRIYAGSDIFLMPSRFEPCGLNQMVAMRYGAVPVVHATGGLADTVHDYDARTGEGNGFSFERYDAMALYAALVRATETLPPSRHLAAADAPLHGRRLLVAPLGAEVCGPVLSRLGDAAPANQPLV